MERTPIPCLRFLAIALLLCVGCQSKWISKIDPELGQCRAERQRLTVELAEVRSLRDQYRAELDRSRGGTPEIPVNPTARATPAGASIDSAQRDAESARVAAEKSAAGLRATQANLAAAESRGAALERQVADLNSQLAKTRQDLEAETQQRIAVQNKALAADSAAQEAAAARSSAADLQKQLDAALREKQQLTAQLETLRQQR
jgi:hypothetical protein